MKGNKKTVVIVLLILFVLVGGAGGYLLWRVNQEKTVSPTDSDAAPNCLDVLTCFSYTSDENGYLQYVVDPNTEVQPIKEPLNITLKNSCASAKPILAVPNDPDNWEFDHWEITKNTTTPCSGDGGSVSSVQNLQNLQKLEDIQKGTVQEVSPKTNPRTDNAGNQCNGESCSGKSWKVKAVFKKKTPSEGDCQNVPTCFSYTTDGHGNLEYANRPGEFMTQPLTITLNNSCAIGQSIRAVPSSQGWEFDHWEVTESIMPCGASSEVRNVGVAGPDVEIVSPTANPRTDKASNRCKDSISCLGLTWDVKAIFKQKQSPLLYTVTYSYTPGDGGRLKKDGVLAPAYTSILLQDIVPGTKGPLVEAVPNENYKFDGWFENDGKGGILNPDKPVSTSPSRQDIINSSFAVIARFSPKLKGGDQDLFTVTYSYTPAEGGRLKKDGEFIPANTSIVLKDVVLNTKGPLVEAVPNANFKFDGWFKSDGKGGVSDLISNDSKRQDTITSSFTLVAKFSSTTTPPGGGETPPSGGETPPSGGTKPTLTVGTPTTTGTGKDGGSDDLPDTAMATTSKITILVGSIFLFVGLGLGWPKVVETFLTKENVPYVVHPEISSKVKSKKK